MKMTEEMKLNRSIERIMASDLDDAAKLKRLDNLYWRQDFDRQDQVKAVMLTFPAYARKMEGKKTAFSIAIKILNGME